MFKFICLVACVSYVCADIGITSNQYLPPNKDQGYNYNRPSVPFPSQQPSAPPAPPKIPSPSYGVPIPPARPYLPPAAASSPIPSAPSRPYLPPSPAASRPAPTQAEHHHEPGMPFDFTYAVKDEPSHNDYSHKAVSDGDVTRGEYRTQLPDGRVQVVRYTADWKNGYNAEVTYEGQASYPTPDNGGYKY